VNKLGITTKGSKKKKSKTYFNKSKIRKTIGGVKSLKVISSPKLKKILIQSFVNIDYSKRPESRKYQRKYPKIMKNISD